MTGTKYEPNIDEASTALCSLLGPSILLPSSFYVAASAMQKPIYAWVVDSKTDLKRALNLGLQAAVSNTPLSLQKVIERWQSIC